MKGSVQTADKHNNIISQVIILMFDNNFRSTDYCDLKPIFFCNLISQFNTHAYDTNKKKKKIVRLLKR